MGERFMRHFSNLEIVRFERFPIAISFEVPLGESLESWEARLGEFAIVKEAYGYMVCP